MTRANDTGPRPGDRIGPYLVKDALGEGGMGRVYAGHDTTLDRPVAIKLMRADQVESDTARRRFEREVRTAARVHHQHIATIYSALDTEYGVALVMEYIDGRRIDTAARENGCGHEMILRWGAQIAEALAAIHEEEIVHRDLKPGNVMVTRTGRVKVLDFGVARQDVPPPTQTASGTITQLTSPGSMIGTVAYMAPEQLLDKPATAKSDLFALGVTLFELLTGEHPFRRATLAETIDAIRREPPGTEAARGAIEALGPAGKIVLAMLEKNPDARPVDAESVAVGLRELVGPASGSSDRAALRPSVRRKVVFPALLVVAAIATLAWVLVDRPADAPVAQDPAASPLLAIRPPTSEELGDDQLGMAGSVLSSALVGGGTLRVIPAARLSDAGELAALSRMAGESLAWRSSTHLETVPEGFSAHLVLEDEEGGARVFEVRAPTLVAVCLRAAQRIRREVAPEVKPLAIPLRAGLFSTSDEAQILYETALRDGSKGRFTEAITKLERSLLLDRHFSAARLSLAGLLDEAGYESRAREQISMTLQRLADYGAAEDSRLLLEARAMDARIHFRYDDAARIYERLANAVPTDASLRGRHAEALHRASRYSEALDVLGEAIRVDALDPDLHVARARTLAELGRFEEARGAIAEALRLYELFARPARNAEAAFVRAYVLFREGELEESIAAYDEAARRFDQAGLPVMAAEAQRSKGDLQAAIWDVEGAEESLSGVLATAEKAGNFALVVTTLRSLGILHLRMGRYGEATERLRAAADESRKLGNPHLELGVQLNLAVALNAVGRHREAMDRAEVASSLAKSAEDEARIAFARLQLGVAECHVSGLSSCLPTLRSVAEAGDAVPATTPMYAWQAMARAYESHEKPGRFAEACERATAAADELKIDVSRGFGRALRALAHADLGRADAAMRDAADAQALLGRVRGQEGLAAIADAALLAAELASGRASCPSFRPERARELLELEDLDYERRRALEMSARCALRGDSESMAVAFAEKLASADGSDIERLRGRSLLAVAKASKGRQEAPDDVAELRSEARRLGLHRTAAALSRVMGESDADDVRRYLEDLPEDARDAARRRLSLDSVRD